MYDLDQLLDLSDQTPTRDLCEIIAGQLNDDIDFLFDELASELNNSSEGILFERLGSFASSLYKFTSLTPSFDALYNLVEALSRHITTLRHAAVTAVSFISAAPEAAQRHAILTTLCYKKKTSYIPISGKIALYTLFKETDFTALNPQQNVDLMSFLIDLANGETQPLCLYYFFSEMKRLMPLIDYTQNYTVDECELDQLVSDSFCCYFPLVYNPTPEQALKIPRQEMHDLYRSLFFSVTKISQNAIDFLIDILDSSTEQEAPEIYKILAEIIQKTDVDLDEISGLMFNITRALVNPSTKQIRGALNEMLRVVVSRKDLKKWDELCEGITNIVIREYKFDSGDAGIRAAICAAYIESCRASQDFSAKADLVILEAISDFKTKIGLIDIVDVHNNSVSAKAVRIMTLSFLCELFSVIKIPENCFDEIIDAFSESLIDVSVDKEFEMLTRNLVNLARQSPEKYLDRIAEIAEQLMMIPEIFAVIRALSLRGKKLCVSYENKIYLETDPELLADFPVKNVAEMDKILTFIETPINSILVSNVEILLQDPDATIKLLENHEISENSAIFEEEKLQIPLFLAKKIKTVKFSLSKYLEFCKIFDHKKIVDVLLANLESTSNDLSETLLSQIFDFVTRNSNLQEMIDLVNKNQLSNFEIVFLVRGANIDLLANLMSFSKNSASFLALFSSCIEFHGKNFLEKIQSFQEEIIDDLIEGIRSSNSSIFCRVLCTIYRCNEALILRNYQQIIVSVEHQIYSENWKISRNIDVIILSELLCAEAEAKEHQRSMSLALGYVLESPFYEIRKQARVARQNYLSL